jgi:hypothetical protein
MNGQTGFFANITTRRSVAAALCVFFCGLAAFASAITSRPGAHGARGYLELEPTLLAAGLLLTVAAARLCLRRPAAESFPAAPESATAGRGGHAG